VAYRLSASARSSEEDAREIAALAEASQMRTRRVALVVGAIVTALAALIFVAGLFAKRDPRIHCTKVTVTYEAEAGAHYKPPGSWSYCER
jgi:hypothetical protein